MSQTQAVDGRPRICRLEAAGGPERLGPALDAIFFEASLVKTFASDGHRRAFRERWIGRYLARFPELVHVALGADGALVGYIVGAHGDPAQDTMFADIGYWPAIAHLTAAYPAHLHINLAPQARSQGIGSRLIEAFVADVAAAGVRGVHLVTGATSRNRSFYARNGFDEAAAFGWHGTPLVMLARSA